MDKNVKEPITLDSAEQTVQGVIKNISDANDILKNLLRNYKHLKKICDSFETEESRQNIGEIEDLFNDSNVKRKIYHNDDRNSKKVTKKKTKKKLNEGFVTRMFITDVSDDNLSKQNENYENEEIDTIAKIAIDKSIEKSKKNIKTKLRKHKKKHKNDASKITIFDEINVEEEEHIRNLEPLKHKRVKLVKRIENAKSVTPKTDNRNTIEDSPKWYPRVHHNFRKILEPPALLIIANSSVR